MAEGVANESKQSGWSRSTFYEDVKCRKCGEIIPAGEPECLKCGADVFGGDEVLDESMIPTAKKRGPGLPPKKM